MKTRQLDGGTARAGRPAEESGFDLRRAAEVKPTTALARTCWRRAHYVAVLFTMERVRTIDEEARDLRRKLQDVERAMDEQSNATRRQRDVSAVCRAEFDASFVSYEASIFIIES